MFNVRAYGILIEPDRGVLVSDEWINDVKITKFCGGGLEYGEGLIECLKREFLEEMNLPVEVEEHFYTTDFFQPSAYHIGQQIISVYYKVKALEVITVPLREEPFAFDEEQLKEYERLGSVATFRFIPREKFSVDSVSLPIDKVVAGMMVTLRQAQGEEM